MEPQNVGHRSRSLTSTDKKTEYGMNALKTTHLCKKEFKTTVFESNMTSHLLK